MLHPSGPNPHTAATAVGPASATAPSRSHCPRRPTSVRPNILVAAPALTAAFRVARSVLGGGTKAMYPTHTAQKPNRNQNPSHSTETPVRAGASTTVASNTTTGAHRALSLVLLIIRGALTHAASTWLNHRKTHLDTPKGTLVVVGSMACVLASFLRSAPPPAGECSPQTERMRSLLTRMRPRRNPSESCYQRRTTVCPKMRL